MINLLKIFTKVLDIRGRHICSLNSRETVMHFKILKAQKVRINQLKKVKVVILATVSIDYTEM